MVYGSKEYKNGKVKGTLLFDSGKKIHLNEEEKRDFDEKIKWWIYEGIEREKHKRSK